MHKISYAPTYGVKRYQRPRVVREHSNKHRISFYLFDEMLESICSSINFLFYSRVRSKLFYHGLLDLQIYHNSPCDVMWQPAKYICVYFTTVIVTQHYTGISELVLRFSHCIRSTILIFFQNTPCPQLFVGNEYSSFK